VINHKKDIAIVILTFLSQKVMLTEDLKIAQSVYVDFSTYCNPNIVDIFGALCTLSLKILREGGKDVNNILVMVVIRTSPS